MIEYIEDVALARGISMAEAAQKLYNIGTRWLEEDLPIHIIATDYRRAIRIASDFRLQHYQWTYCDKPQKLRGTQKPVVLLEDEFIPSPQIQWELKSREARVYYA